MSYERNEKIKDLKVKSEGSMHGEIIEDGIYKQKFTASFVLYLSNQHLIQIYGAQDFSSPEHIGIDVELKAGTLGGHYKFGSKEITSLGYYPPLPDGPWVTTGGGINVTFDSENRAVRGDLLIECEYNNKKLNVMVSFSMHN